MTPFEMGGLIIEVQAPLLVFREWHRHRTQSYNELSARYTKMPDINYVPSIERLMINAGASNKQAGTIKGAQVLTVEQATLFRESLITQYADAERIYERELDFGIPKELARLVIPVGRYSRMRASANLRNWLGFLTLRQDKAAQWEIRMYANAVGELVADHFPHTWELFDAGRA
jgi:thymidylate synthase (FAD)